MDKELKIQLASFTSFVFIMLFLTYFLNGLHSILILFFSIIVTFYVSYFFRRKLILLVPIIATLLVVDLLVLQLYVEKLLWYIIFLFLNSFLVLTLVHFVRVIKELKMDDLAIVDIFSFIVVSFFTYTILKFTMSNIIINNSFVLLAFGFVVIGIIGFFEILGSRKTF